MTNRGKAQPLKDLPRDTLFDMRNFHIRALRVTSSSPPPSYHKRELRMFDALFEKYGYTFRVVKSDIPNPEAPPEYPDELVWYKGEYLSGKDEETFAVLFNTYEDWGDQINSIEMSIEWRI